MAGCLSVNADACCHTSTNENVSAIPGAGQLQVVDCPQGQPGGEGKTMPDYKAPRRDIQFLLHEVFNAEEHYKALRGDEDVNRDLIDAIVEEGAKFCENELAPLNRPATKKAVALKTASSLRPRASRKPTASTSKVAGRLCPLTWKMVVRVCPTPWAS